MKIIFHGKTSAKVVLTLRMLADTKKEDLQRKILEKFLKSRFPLVEKIERLKVRGNKVKLDFFFSAKFNFFSTSQYFCELPRKIKSIY